jgi:hypothetical protein
VEDDGDARRQERDIMHAQVEDLTGEANGMKCVARSRTQEVDGLKAEVARLKDDLRSINREFCLTREEMGVGNGGRGWAEADLLTVGSGLAEVRD